MTTEPHTPLHDELPYPLWSLGANGFLFFRDEMVGQISRPQLAFEAIQACNAYPVLVEALKLAETTIDNADCADLCDSVDALLAIREALAKAGVK